MSKNNIIIDRKILSELVVNDEAAFKKVVECISYISYTMSSKKDIFPKLSREFGGSHPINQTKDFSRIC